jgi:hypothetical protein
VKNLKIIYSTSEKINIDGRSFFNACYFNVLSSKNIFKMNNLFVKNLIGERKKNNQHRKKISIDGRSFLLLAFSKYIQEMLLLRLNVFVLYFLMKKKEQQGLL